MLGLPALPVISGGGGGDLGDIGVDATAGSVIFADGSGLAEDNDKLFFDDTNDRLGINVGTDPGSTLSVAGTDTVASAANASAHAVEIEDYTLTYTGTTQVTASPGVAGLRIGTVTVTDGSALTVDTAAALYVEAAPAADGSVTITNAYALWIASGVSLFQGPIAILRALEDATAVSPALQVTEGAHTDVPTNAEVNSVYFDLSATINFDNGGGTSSAQRAFRVEAPTYTADAAYTITDAATLYIDAAPTASTNVTITNAWVISAARDTDASFAFGRARIDSRASDFTYLSHFDQSGTGAYMIRQRFNGQTAINTVAQPLLFAVSNSVEFNLDTTSGFYANDANGPALVNEAANATNPTLIPDRSDLDTGISAAGAALHFIIAGTSRANLDSGNFEIGRDTDPSVTNTYDFGAPSTRWRRLFISRTADFTQAAESSGTPDTILVVDHGAHTSLANSEWVGVDFDFASNTVEFDGNGTIALQRAFRVQAPTYAGESGVGDLAITRAVTMQIDGAPSEGTQCGILGASALRVLGTTTVEAASGGDTKASAIWIDDYTVTLTGTTQQTGAPAVGGMIIGDITITDASAVTVDNAAALYIKDAPTAAGNLTLSNPYALWVDAGVSRFDGDGAHVFALPTDNTDPTGGGGAATGRIPINIGGATRYLAYYT